MKKLPIAQLLAMGLISASVQANAYQAEATGDIGTVDNGVASDSTLITVGGEFYFNGVNSSTGPLEESAFIDKAASVRASYSDFDNNNDGIILGGRYVDPNSNFFGEAAAATGGLQGHEVTAGIYLDSQTTASVSIIEEFATEDGLDGADGFGVDYKTLISQNNGTYLNLEGGVSLLELPNNISDYTQFDIGADYYLDKTLSFGGTAALYTGDVDGELFGVRANKFFTPMVKAQLSLSRENTDFNDGVNTIALSGAVRF